MKHILAIAVLVAIPLLGQNRATRPKVVRPDGPVWNVIRANCTVCHGIDDYAFFALDNAGWHSLLAQKHKPGEADLKEADRELLLDYLTATFGPDSKPFPRNYVPPEITTFFSDPEAFRMMNRACTKCHGVDRVQGTRKPAEGWRVTLVDMRERGTELADDDLERLVEWLGRVWGTNDER
jgi:mono/diheme cytochrome c family protein